MAIPARHWSVDDLGSLPEDGNRYEIIGEALHVEPAPALRHQRMVKRLLVLFERYLEAHPVGEVIQSPADAIFSRTTVLQPDLLVLPLIGGRKAESWKDAGPLLVAIEVLSPSTAGYDRYEKRPVYQREGVPDIWIVDGDYTIVVISRDHPLT